MVILGLGFTDHETSAALVIGGKLVTAIARERLTRIKRDGKSRGSKKLDLGVAIRYCLEEHHLALGDVDLLVWSHIDHQSPIEVTVLLALEGGTDFSGIPVLVLPHHFAHACCTFYLSPFREAAVLIADGRGGTLHGLVSYCTGPESESVRDGKTIVQDLRDDTSRADFEHESFYYCDGERWTSLRKVIGEFRDGIGRVYGSVSQLLFADPLDAGKTMGLAPYGRPDGRRLLDGTQSGELHAFKAIPLQEWKALKAQVKAWRDAALPVRYEDDPLLANLAACVQHEAEEAMLAHAQWLRGITGSGNLCLSGGVALNCVANSYLAREAGFGALFVPPAPGDDGIAVGCALYGAALHGELQRGACPVFLGRSYSHDPNEFLAMGLAPVPTGRDGSGWVAERLAQGAVVGWYQGGAELGPRALGHRSILADPRRSDMRDYLNRVVKLRESFRPFAPVVREEAVLDYFEERHPSYFMSFVATIRAEKRSSVPAITHVDGTARYQVLRKVDNPQLYELIEAFERLTGVPMLLNTSFNRAGEPIVETPQEAARCTLASSMDYLVVDGSVYAGQDQGGLGRARLSERPRHRASARSQSGPWPPAR